MLYRIYGGSHDGITHTKTKLLNSRRFIYLESVVSLVATVISNFDGVIWGRGSTKLIFLVINWKIRCKPINQLRVSFLKNLLICCVFACLTDEELGR